MVRRQIIQNGLVLLITRELAETRFGAAGITYAASPLARPFLAYLESDYARDLLRRAAWVVATFGSVEVRLRFIASGMAIVCAGLVGLALAGNLVVAILCAALIGFGLILFLATSQSVVQLSTGEHNRGVLMGIWAVTLSGAVPVGNLLAGPAADHTVGKIAIP